MCIRMGRSICVGISWLSMILVAHLRVGCRHRIPWLTARRWWLVETDISCRSVLTIVEILLGGMNGSFRTVMSIGVILLALIVNVVWLSSFLPGNVMCLLQRNVSVRSLPG